MKLELKRVSFPILVLFFICKSSLGDSLLEQHGQQTSAQQLAQPSDEQRRDTEVAKDFMRYFLLNLRNNYPSVNHFGRIPFRPVRRLGSEFLGKRRLGNEFLGKRSNNFGEDENEMLSHSPQNPDLSIPEIAADKRALGNEFLGKRKPSLWDWSWKRGLGSGRGLGSEFLGKRSLGSDPEELQEVPSAALLQ